MINIKQFKRKSNQQRFFTAVIVLVVLMLVGLALGGIQFTWQVLKNYVIGVAIGAAILLVLMILGKTPLKKNKLISILSR